MEKKETLAKMQAALAAFDAPDRPFVNLGVHITCNEGGLATTYRRLDDGGGKGRCHVGFSGWFNLDVACRRRSEAIIICDANPESTQFVRHTLELVALHRERKTFVNAMCRVYNWEDGPKRHTHFAPFLHDDATLYAHDTEDLVRTSLDLAAQLLFSTETSFAKRRPERAEDEPIAEMRCELKRADSWLATDERYAFVRGLALTERITALTCDACDVERLAQVRAIVEAYGLVIDTLYVSNIEDYVNQEPERYALYRQMLQRMTGANTCTIHTNSTGRLVQGVIFGPLGAELLAA
jgi:hypothetical protein